MKSLSGVHVDTSLKLSEKTALITNACSSMGRALSLRLSELGAHVAMVDGPSKGGDRMADEIMNLREVHEKRGKAAFFQANYGDWKSMQDTVGRAAESFGGLDILVDTQIMEANVKFSQGFSESKFDELVQANLKTTLVMTQKACEFFKVRKRGRIVYLLQELHRVGFEGDAISGLSRSGLVTFAKALAREFIQDQVTINCLSVGPTEEYLLQKMPGAKSIQVAHQELFKSYPGVKIADPNEVANLVAFLASPLASGVTGQCISAAGALSLLS